MLKISHLFQIPDIYFGVTLPLPTFLHPAPFCPLLFLCQSLIHAISPACSLTLCAYLGNSYLCFQSQLSHLFTKFHQNPKYSLGLVCALKMHSFFITLGHGFNYVIIMSICLISSSCTWTLSSMQAS